jgi:EAL domain-containing protein (putative c-di-GMP-specific phosphodiesterase class I)
LRRALERNEFILEYQPKLDLKTGRITGVEALVRWSHPQLGLVSPAQFIPIAEETGLIVPLGKWVIEQACQQNVMWQSEGLPPISIAVNLSPRQFADDGLPKDIAAAISNSGMRPELLELEITESMMMRSVERAASVLRSLKAMGVTLAIDDFGTGYSSFTLIRRFPIDTLKIDRSFIQDMPGDAESRAITEAIIAMGKTLHLRVVAEGVETKAQRQFLCEHGCDEMQGYYLSTPVNPKTLGELLRRNADEP